MAPRSRTRIALTLLVAALTFGAFAATASAHRGSGSDSGTTTAGKQVALVGTVATVDPTARTLTLTVKDRGKHRGWRHHGKGRFARAAHHGKRGRSAETRTVTVLANELALPAVGDKLLVKGTTQADGSVSATELRVLTAANTGDDDGDRGDCNGKSRHGDDDDDDRRGS